MEFRGSAQAEAVVRGVLAFLDQGFLALRIPPCADWAHAVCIQTPPSSLPPRACNFCASGGTPVWARYPQDIVGFPSELCRHRIGTLTEAAHLASLVYVYDWGKRI